MHARCRRALQAPISGSSLQQTRRSLFFGKWRTKAQKGDSQNVGATSTAAASEPLLQQDNLLHPLSESPVPAMRVKAERIKSLSRSPLLNASVQFECVRSGWPTHHDQAEYDSDSSQHARYWPTLKQVNEDEHDLRSGRPLAEFEGMPGTQPYEETISMANWDVFFYTRGFPSIDSDRSRRHISKLLTYPITIATVLHENSPYNTRSQRLTNEGARSLAALRQSLHPPLGGASRPHLLTSPLRPLRIIILGARAESSLPASVWEQLSHLFPNIPFHIVFVGPEVILPPKAQQRSEEESQKAVGKGIQKGLRSTTQFGVPATVNVHSHTLTLTSLQAPYEEMHEALGPFDPYRDVFFAFQPGFGSPSDAQPKPDDPLPAETYWKDTLLQILDTKCAFFCTGFSPADVERDILALDRLAAVEEEAAGFEWVLAPGENPFGSAKVEVAEFDYRVMAQTNWGVWGIRGKRYDVQSSDDFDREEGLVAAERAE